MGDSDSTVRPYRDARHDHRRRNGRRGRLPRDAVRVGNRDEAAFGPTADRFVATRPIAVPNLAFGFGEHLCLGAALARLEARVVFEELLARYPRYEIAGEAEWLPSSLVRGPDSVPVVFA